jgi:hypothetical protein
MVGLAGYAILVGVGLHLWPRVWFRGRLADALRAITIGCVLVLIARQTYETREFVGIIVADLLTDDPCGAGWVRERPFADAFVFRVKAHYGMDDPLCVGE